MYRRTVASAGVLVLLLAVGLGAWALLRADADLQRLYGRGFAALGVVAGLALLVWSRRIPPGAGAQHANRVRSHRGAVVGTAALLVALIAAVIVAISSVDVQTPPPALDPAPSVPDRDPDRSPG